MYSGTTVWKFHRFYITQTLRKINFGLSRSAKSTILTHLEALIFDFYVFLHSERLKFSILTLIRATEIEKWQFLNFSILQNECHVEFE